MYVYIYIYVDILKLIMLNLTEKRIYIYIYTCIHIYIYVKTEIQVSKDNIELSRSDFAGRKQPRRGRSGSLRYATKIYTPPPPINVYSV